MKLRVNRLELKYWFWEYHGLQTRSPLSTYLTIIRGYYDPETRIIRGIPLGSAVLVGTKWREMAVNATRTRRSRMAMCKWLRAGVRADQRYNEQRFTRPYLLNFYTVGQDDSLVSEGDTLL